MRIRSRFALASIVAVLLPAVPTAAYAHIVRAVQPGESLWSIAVVNGIGVEHLAAENGLSPDAQLLIGATVSIPDGPAVAAPAPAPAPALEPPAPEIDAPPPDPATSGECVWDCGSPVHPHPTAEVVSPETVESIAARHGMSPSLVQAMAWVESGYNNALVSSADARGVMQIIPDTWELIDGSLTSGSLNPQSATANVEAGVLYLRHLYRVTGGDPDRSVGSYFQGPNRETLLPETLDYIRTVRGRQAALTGGAP